MDVEAIRTRNDARRAEYQRVQSLYDDIRDVPLDKAAIEDIDALLTALTEAEQGRQRSLGTIAYRDGFLYLDSIDFSQGAEPCIIAVDGTPYLFVCPTAADAQSLMHRVKVALKAASGGE